MGTLYVAYGSNMNLEQMAYRCPTATIVGVCNIPGYKLEFRGIPEHSFATITPKEKAKTPGLLWEIKPYDEQRLDLYEGFPRQYRKEIIKVKIGRKVYNAMVYIMNGDRAITPPSDFYYETIKIGYDELGIDDGPLAKAYIETLEINKKTNQGAV